MKSEAFGKWASILLKNFTYGVVPRGGIRAQEALAKMTETAKTFDDWFTLKGCAHLMWEDRFEQVALDKMIETAETFDDWLQIFDNNRWESILVKMSETAKTLKDWRIVWQWSLRCGGDLQQQAEKEMVTLARNSQTFNDWHNTYMLTGPRISYSSSLGDTSCWPSEIHRVNQLAWTKMSETAKTFYNWLDIYSNLSPESQLEDQILTKICETAKTFNDWRYIYHHNLTKPTLIGLAWTKMFEIAKTYDDLYLLFGLIDRFDFFSEGNTTPEFKEFKESVLAKMKELQTTED